MGTDISGVVECRPRWAREGGGEAASWEAALDLFLLDVTRSYDAFGCLFGVRNHAGFRPFAADRGMPADASDRRVHRFRRKTGASRRIHDALLSGRGEPQVTLMVNAQAGNGKVHHLYETWGYKDLGASQPSLDSPVLMAMLRDLRSASRLGPSTTR